MLEDTLTSENFEDFKQRYQGCYGFLSLNDKDVLCKITAVSPDKVSFDTEKGKDFWAYVDKDVKFKFMPVTRGWYAASQEAILFLRVPARQFARGITGNNTICMRYVLGRLQTSRFGFSEINAMLRNVEPMYDIENKCAQRLSKHFAVSPVLNNKQERHLWLFDREVGIVTNKQVTIHYDAIKQEFMDLNKRRNLGLEIV